MHNRELFSNVKFQKRTSQTSTAHCPPARGAWWVRPRQRQRVAARPGAGLPSALALGGPGGAGLVSASSESRFCAAAAVCCVPAHSRVPCAAPTGWPPTRPQGPIPSKTPNLRYPLRDKRKPRGDDFDLKDDDGVYNGEPLRGEEGGGGGCLATRGRLLAALTRWALS